MCLADVEKEGTVLRAFMYVLETGGVLGISCNDHSDDTAESEMNIHSGASPQSI
jgi:hypothetical protein